MISNPSIQRPTIWDEDDTRLIERMHQIKRDDPEFEELEFEGFEALMQGKEV